MRHIMDGRAADAVCRAIDRHLATPVPEAHREMDGCVVDYYVFGQHVYRCEHDLFDDERHVEELAGAELADFRYCRDLLTRDTTSNA